jgi:hypothetical protein
MKAASQQIKAAGGGIAGASAVLRQDLVLLSGELRQAGITVNGALSEGELAAIVRSAFDPAVQLDARSDAGARLRTAGPMFLNEYRDAIQTDSGWSTVLWVSEWPRVGVSPNFLHALIFPEGVQRTFTLISRPVPTVESLKQIRREKVGGIVDARHKARVGQVDDYRDTQAHADVVAREMSIHHGHPDMEFLGLITVTAATRDELAAATQRIVRAAGSSFCEVRTLVGRQAQGFVLAALPFARTAHRGTFQR